LERFPIAIIGDVTTNIERNITFVLVCWCLLFTRYCIYRLW